MNVNFDPSQLLAFLQHQHKISPSLVVESVSIEYVQTIDCADLKHKQHQDAYDRAMVTFTSQSKYSVASYDTKWMATEVLQKIKKAPRL